MQALSLSSSLLAAALILAAATPARAENPMAAQMQAAFDKLVTPVLAEAVVQEALAAANTAHGAMTAEQIAAADQVWKDASGGAEFARIAGTPCSQRLKALQEGSSGAVVEIFVVSAKGLNVCQSSLTSDFYQGESRSSRRRSPAGPRASSSRIWSSTTAPDSLLA